MTDTKADIGGKETRRSRQDGRKQDNPAANPEGKNGKHADDVREQMLRIAAEFDNYKKRTHQELDAAKRTGRAELVKSLLPIIDEFELALIAASKAEDKVLAKGIEMLYSNLMDTLKREGLSEVPTRGPFDPYKHEIMMVRESDKSDGTILEVIKKGYSFGNILLRPASVITSKAAQPQSDAQSASQSDASDRETDTTKQ